MGKVKVGDQLPDFSLPNQVKDEVNPSQYYGRKNLVIFFYPKDETPGCTAEACAFRDFHYEFVQAGAEVIGISSDSVRSHKEFTIHHDLPFHLLSDKGGKVRKLFGVPRALAIIPGRVTYVANKQGQVVYLFNSLFNARQHVENALTILKDL